MLVVPIPWYQAEDGSIWVDDLWHRDLVRHLEYLNDLTVLAPRLPLAAVDGLTRIDERDGLQFRELPWGNSLKQLLIRAPAALVAAARTVSAADIVHSGAAGWPLPPGIFVNPLAVVFRRPLIIVVESAFWRLVGSGPFSRKERLRASVTEAFARWSVRRSALSIFTHEGYREGLTGSSDARFMVTPASWIDSEDVLSMPAAEAGWKDKSAPLRVLLAARLTEGKGISVLLKALDLAGASQLPLSVDVIGDGPLREAVATAAGRLGQNRLRLLQPVPYGAPFLQLLHDYHAVLVPTITDEQPRILFDAASQALPVLASDTPGNRGLIKDGVNGYTFASDDPKALLDVLRRATENTIAMRNMGLAARTWAEVHTHQTMHLERAQWLVEIWNSRRGPRAA